MGNYLPVEDMREGWLYRIEARNARFGLWFKDNQGFVIRRDKFGSIYTFVEIHWDLSDNLGTAKPIETLERSPFSVLDTVYTMNNARPFMSTAKEDEILEYLRLKEIEYDITPGKIGDLKYDRS